MVHSAAWPVTTSLTSLLLPCLCTLHTTQTSCARLFTWRSPVRAEILPSHVWLYLGHSSHWFAFSLELTSGNPTCAPSGSPFCTLTSLCPQRHISPSLGAHNFVCTTLVTQIMLFSSLDYRHSQHSWGEVRFRAEESIAGPTSTHTICASLDLWASASLPIKYT